MKRKSTYELLQKHNRSVSRILISQENPKCIKCNKKINITKECQMGFIDGWSRGKGKKKTVTYSSAPFYYLSGNFVDDLQWLLCHKCGYDVQRFIGLIPDRDRYEVFPNVSTPLDLDHFKAGIKKRLKWTLWWGKKTFPHTKKLKNKFMDQAVKAYKKKYPYVPHTEKQLKGLINGYRRYDKRYRDY